MRVVIDTNVFISGCFLKSRLPRFDELVVERRFTWLMSHEIFEEYLEVATDPKLHLTGDDVRLVFGRLKSQVEWVDVHPVISAVPQDPSDDKFLACAIDGRADYLVSGDRHLLALRRFRGIPIVSPVAFLRV